MRGLARATWGHENMVSALKHLGDIAIDLEAQKTQKEETQSTVNKSKLLGMGAFSQQTQLVQKGEADVLKTIRLWSFYRLS